MEGELDATAVDVFAKALTEVISAGKPQVVVDLSGTRFLALRAAWALGEAHRQALDHGVDLRLVSRRSGVERALEVTGVRAAFRYYPTVQAALAP